MGLYLLIQEGLNVEGLHDVRVELREQESVPDTLVQQLPHLCHKKQMSDFPESLVSAVKK